MNVHFQYEVIGGPRDGGAIHSEHLLSAGHHVWVPRGERLIDLYRAWWSCRLQRIVLVFDRTEVRPENEVNGC